ncbi:MAG: hypothetical protein U0992_12045 [Planctomycetaceae bacterium]
MERGRRLGGGGAWRLERVADGATLRFSFAFRAVAGGICSACCSCARFGVTVGAHALYDLLVGVVMQPA